MLCDCCGKKKRIFESFAEVNTKNGKMNFCIDCNDIAYKVRDDADELNRANFDKHMKEWKKRAQKPSNLFVEWQKGFVAPLEAKFQEQIDNNEFKQ